MSSTPQFPVLQQPASTKPGHRRLIATQPLRKDEHAEFTLAQSSRRVDRQRIQRTWLQPSSAVATGDAAVILDRLIDDLHEFEITDRAGLTRHSFSPNHYEPILADSFIHLPDARRRANTAIAHLMKHGLITRVFHHVMELDQLGAEHLRRIQRYVPTMRAWSESLEPRRRDLLEAFWRDRIEAGHAWDRNRHSLSDTVKKYVRDRDDWRCQSYGYAIRSPRCSFDCYLEVDHIIPIAAGGSDHADNLQALCHWCNCNKGAQIIQRRTLHFLVITATAGPGRTNTNDGLIRQLESV